MSQRILSLLALAAMCAPAAYAQDKQTEDAAAKADPVKFDSGDVWNADIYTQDDHKVLVIHDRKYTKAGRFEVGLHGALADMSFAHNTFGGGLHTAYHFTEYLGIDVFANYSTSSLNRDGKQLQDFLSGIGYPSLKELQTLKLYAGAGVIWSPIYGKFAMFRSSVAYFDFYGTAGLSMIALESNRLPSSQLQYQPATLLGLGARVFVNKTFSLRFDIRNSIYRSSYQATTTNSGTVLQAADTFTRSLFQFTLGFSAMFGG